MRKLTATLVAVSALAIGAAPASAADYICGWYYGARVCTPILRTGPSRATTEASMVARATPKTVKVGSSTKLWMGPKRGQHGFVSGEIVRFFDIYKGKTSEMIGVQSTIKGGIARWGRTYLSMPGVDQTGVHHLCAMGERSRRLACVKITVVWGSGSAVDDSYGGVAGDDYKGVTTETKPTTSSTTAPQATVTSLPAATTTTNTAYSAPSAGEGFSAPVAG